MLKMKGHHCRSWILDKGNKKVYGLGREIKLSFFAHGDCIWGKILKFDLKLLSLNEIADITLASWAFKRMDKEYEQPYVHKFDYLDK